MEQTGNQGTCHDADEGMSKILDIVEQPRATTIPVDEETPLKSHHSIFTVGEKWLIVTMGAMAAFMSTVAANVYFPAIPTIAAAFHKSTELTNLTVTVNMAFQGISPLVLGPVGDRGGRRPMLLLCLLTLSASCIGLASIPTSAYWAFMLLRCFQAAGSASTVALGAGIVGDISIPAERGGFMAIFSIGLMFGPTLGPVVGGALSQHLGWRSIFWFMLIVSAVVFVVLFLFLPETLRALVGNGSIPAPPLNRALIPIIGRSQQQASDAERPPCRGFQNPFTLFLYPDISILLVLNGINFAIFYGVTASISVLFQSAYPFLTETDIGLCFLGMGGGMLLASLTNGRLLDREYRIVQEKMIENLEVIGIEKGQQLKPEDVTREEYFPIEHARLRLLPISWLLSSACSIGYGWSVEKRVPLAVPLILHVIMGYNICRVSNSTQTLLVDLASERSSSVIACNNFTRCSLGAIIVSVVDLIIKGIGIGWTYTLFGCLGLLCLPVVWLVMRMGPVWRARRREKKLKR